MNCYACHRPLGEDSEDGYHHRCASAVFGSRRPPSIPFTYADISAEARKLVGQMSISGVQAKLSVRLSKRNIEVIARGGTHILKPSPEHFPHLAENENLCMNMAKELSIETPPHGLLPLFDGGLVYIVRRFDRKHGEGDLLKIHVEDFTQLLGKRNKYDGSVEQIGKFLKLHSEIPFLDTQKLFIRILFNYLIGNGDAHMKNFSMIKPPDKGFRLAPAYDIVSSRLVIPDEMEDAALSISGKRINISLKVFRSLADYLEMPDKAYKKIISQAVMLNTKAGDIIQASFLPERLKIQFREIISKRHRQLFS